MLTLYNIFNFIHMRYKIVSGNCADTPNSIPANVLTIFLLTGQVPNAHHITHSKCFGSRIFPWSSSRFHTSLNKRTNGYKVLKDVYFSTTSIPKPKLNLSKKNLEIAMTRLAKTKFTY